MLRRSLARLMPKVRRLEQARFGSLAGRRSVEQHERIINFCAARRTAEAAEAVRENWLTLRIFTMPDCVTSREVIDHHTDGWPRDFFTQLAVALDVPRQRLNVPLGIGGPLLTAAAMRLTPKQALKYLE